MKGSVNEAECIAAGVDPVKVEKLVCMLSKAAKFADELNIEIFGGTTGALISALTGSSCGRALVLGCVPGPFNGGDGAIYPDEHGLLRRE